jgi:recombinase
MVDQLSPKTNTASSINLKLISSICTSPLYRKEEWLKQKYQVEKLSARQIAVLIGCSHHSVNCALKRFSMKRDIAIRGRLAFEVRWGPKGRIIPRRLKALVSWMAKLRTQGLSYREIARRLEGRGVKAPSGQVKWYGCTVRSILFRNRQN